jgi:hypothetical protein
MKKILTIDDFDPMNVDTSFLEQVSAEIPQEGYIDPAMAERLATITLIAADKCSDLLAQATLYLSHSDSKRRTTRASVIKRLLSEKVPSTIVKEVYCDDHQYVRDDNKYNMALAWSTWLENKLTTLLKTHHLCKDLIKKSEGVFNASGWETNIDDISKPTRKIVDKPKSGWDV